MSISRQRNPRTFDPPRMPGFIPTQVQMLLRPNAGWIALAAALILTWMGIEAIGTATAAVGNSSRQAGFWLPVSLVVMGMMCLPHPRAIGLLSYTLLGLSILSLVYLIIPGVPFVRPINGATCWIRIGSFSAQPVEVVKILFVLSLAWYLRYRNNYRTVGGLLVPFGIMVLPVLLLLKQPDLGAAVIFAPTLFVILIAAGAKLRHMGALILIGLIIVALNVAVIAIDPPHKRTGNESGMRKMMHILRPHQERRIAAMLFPEHYIKHEGFQQNVSMNLIGAGGVVGAGPSRAEILVRYNRLPEAHNDMIFAVLVNRWGLTGGLAVLGLYLVLILSFLQVATRTKDPFARLSIIGFAGMIFAQTTINIGVAIGLLPVTGVTLPLVSDGGTSLMSTYAMIGLVINFASRRPVLLARPSFEHDPVEMIFQ